MTRILINGRFLTQPISGVQRYARDMVSALAGADTTLALATPRGPADTDGVPGSVELLRDAAPISGAAWEQLRLPGWMKRWNADLLWSPCNVGPLKATRHVVTIHDASVFAGPEWFSRTFRTYYRWVLPRLGSRAERVVTDSEFSKSELARYAVADLPRIRVVRPGVGPEFTPRGGARDPYVLFVGTRDPRKNLKRLIEAWGMLEPGVRRGRTLRIAGGFGRAFSAEALGPLPRDVSLEGYVADDLLPGLYGGAELFVMPSLYEGFGLPALEAMACGTPALVSRAASLPEVCAEGAAYCDPNDVGDIARGMRELLADRTARQALGKKGRARAKQFSWAAAAEALMAVFAEGAAGGE